MKNYIKIASIITMGALLVACGGNNDKPATPAAPASGTQQTTTTTTTTGFSKIRLFHGIADAGGGTTFATIGLKNGNNSQTVVSNVALNGVPNQYFDIPSGDAVRLIVDAPGTGTVITKDSNLLGSGKKYTVVTWSTNGVAGNAAMTVYDDADGAAEAGKVKVRAIMLSQKRSTAAFGGVNAGANNQPMDIWLVSRDDPNNAQTKLADGVLLSGTGGYVAINGTISSIGYNACITLRNAGAAAPLDNNAALGTVTASSNRANPVTAPTAGAGAAIPLTAGQSYTMFISDPNNVVLVAAGYPANAEVYVVAQEPN